MFKNLYINNFRNLKEQRIEFNPKVNIFFGNNGQGKTNIIEALYLITQGQSFRHAENENLILFNKEAAIIKSQLNVNNLDYNVEIILENKRKTQLFNNKKQTPPDFKRNLFCIVFSPESLAQIKEGPDERRHLIDEFITHLNPTSGRTIVDFRKCLRTRNRILRDHLENTIPESHFRDLFESINVSFLKLATDLSIQRIEALRAVLTDFNEAMKTVSKDQSVDISVEYVISDENHLFSDRKKIENALEKRLSELKNAELSSGVSLVGPHKHDIRFLYNGNDSRFYCSQGQQRALILSFKMAQIVYHKRLNGTVPVLLLDDVLSELDEIKKNSLIEFLKHIETQIFLTSTEFKMPYQLEKESYQALQVQDGTIFRG